MAHTEEHQKETETPERSEEELAQIAETLDKLGLALSKTRSEAMDGRELSKIENEWLEDEEHYEGIDDMNRGEISAWRGKPLGQAALRSDDDTGSTVFFNITAPYCDAGAAKLGDMLLPTDDRGWSINPTPIPELISIAKGKVPLKIQNQVNEAFPDDPDKAQQTLDELVDSAKADSEEAKELAEKAQTRIDDWHVESQYAPENRLVIEDSAKRGTGILKGPIPELSRQVAFKNGELIVLDELKPVSRRVSPWNCFPDPGCGESIHNGSYHWERDDITKKQLLDLKGAGYIDSQIDKVIEEGPYRATRDYREGDGRSDQLGLIGRETKNLFEIWYYYGLIEKEDMEAAGCDDCDDDEPVFGLVTMVNNRVIKTAINPLDTGEFPYDYMVWQQRSGSPFGIGISRQLRTAQRIINAAMRNMMDNAGLAGGPMWAVIQGMMEPLDGIYELAPRKGWMVGDDFDSKTDDISKAFSFFGMDMMQGELQAILEIGLKMAEDVTGLPMLLQGQQGDAPDTVGGMQLMNNNASTVMRRIVRLYDDNVTTPHVRRYYTYLLQHGEDSEKGEFVVEARGSSALVERDIQNQQILQMANLVTNPIYGKDPKKWMNEYLKSQRFDPKQFDYDDEDWQQIVENMSQPPQDSAMAIAELRSQTEQFKAGMNERIKMAEIQMENENSERDREVTIAFKSVDQQIEAMKLSGAKEIGLDKIKGMLTEAVLSLNTQRELSIGKTVPQVAVPATEPPGRAADGRAFQE
jgi:hypothetical protein